MGRHRISASFSSRDPKTSRSRRMRWQPPAPRIWRAYATLSGGEKQRVVIARALQSPTCCCLTNPTALDLAYQLEVASLLSRPQSGSGRHDGARDARPEPRRVAVRFAGAPARRPRARPGADARCADRRARAAATTSKRTCAFHERGGTPDGRPDPARAMTVSESTLPRVAAQPRPIRARLAMTLAAHGGLTVATCLLAPLVGSTPISPGAGLRSVDSLRRQRRRADLFVARMPRGPAWSSARRSPRQASSSRRCCGIRWRRRLRLASRRARRSAPSSRFRFGAAVTLGPFSPVPLASLGGAFLAATIVYAMATRPGRAMSTSVLLARRDAQLVLLGADPVRPAWRTSPKPTARCAG